MRPRTLGFALVTIAAAASTSACDIDITDRDPVPVTLSIQGTVRSEATGALISGANVAVGYGGHFSLRVVLKEVQSDAAGNYTIEQPYTCPSASTFLWLEGKASGFETSDIEDSRHGVKCTSDRQTIDVQLKPLP